MKLSSGTIKILEKLHNNGYKAYAVGGAVRDFLLCRDIDDVDITTSATPSQMLEVFSEDKVFLTGLKHGTITVIIDRESFEVTTFRKDNNYTDKRHPESVDFVSDLRTDLERRDFTINAMAYNKEEGIIDLYGGRLDVKNKIIRAVGDADKRFNEDALRILRAIRFASVLGFTIEYQTAQAIHKNKSLLNNISKERIYAELTKILVGDNVEGVMQEYKDVFFEIIPKLKDCDGFDHKSKFHAFDVYTHIVKSIALSSKDTTIRLAMLFHDIEKPSCFSVNDNGVGRFLNHQEKSSITANKILRELRADNKTISQVCFLVKYHDSQVDPCKKAIKKWLNSYGVEYLKNLMLVKIADSKAHSTIYTKKRENDANKVIKIIEEIVKNNECYSLNTLKVDGNDLIKRGYTGSQIGEKLCHLLDLVINEEVENDKEKLLKLI